MLIADAELVTNSLTIDEPIAIILIDRPLGFFAVGEESASRGPRVMSGKTIGHYSDGISFKCVRRNYDLKSRRDGMRGGSGENCSTPRFSWIVVPPVRQEPGLPVKFFN